MVRVEDLKPHPKNRNTHPEAQIDELAEILEYQGWRYPIKVSNRSGFMTSGHGRRLAAILKGWEEVPVDFQDYDDDDQEYADVVADNAIALWAELDVSKIKDDISNLKETFDIRHLGIKDFTLSPDVEDKIKDPKAIEAEEGQFLVVVDCKDEQTQAELFEELQERGMECKLLS